MTGVGQTKSELENIQKCGSSLSQISPKCYWARVLERKCASPEFPWRTLRNHSEGLGRDLAATHACGIVIGKMKVSRTSLFLPVLLLAASFAQAGSYQYFRIGNRNDTQTKPAPGIAMMGGGDDLDDAFRWLCQKGNGGDFLILRATGDDDPGASAARTFRSMDHSKCGTLSGSFRCSTRRTRSSLVISFTDRLLFRAFSQ